MSFTIESIVKHARTLSMQDVNALVTLLRNVQAEATERELGCRCGDWDCISGLHYCEFRRVKYDEVMLGPRVMRKIPQLTTPSPPVTSPVTPPSQSPQPTSTAPTSPPPAPLMTAAEPRKRGRIDNNLPSPPPLSLPPPFEYGAGAFLLCAMSLGHTPDSHLEPIPLHED